MRIIGGELRGRILESPEGLDTRPTGDRARGAIFNILNHGKWVPHPAVLGGYIMDVFAGTGALGIEALSQGGADAVFMESSPKAATVCERNIAKMKLDTRARLLRADATNPPVRPEGFPPRTLVFLDPPYGKNLGGAALVALAQKGWIASNAVCVLEMAKKQQEPVPENFTVHDERNYGVALVRFMTYTPENIPTQSAP